MNKQKYLNGHETKSPSEFYETLSLDENWVAGEAEVDKKTKLIDSHAAWVVVEKTPSLISATRERGVWKGMVSNAVKQST